MQLCLWHYHSIWYHASNPPTDASGQQGAAYGQGSGPILLDQVQCFGNESDIFDCPRNDIGMHNCIHNQDAGVTCTARESSTPPCNLCSTPIKS